MAGYVTAATVKAFTHVRPGDLGLDTPEELDTLLDGWSDDVKDLIDEYKHRDYLADAGGDLAQVSGSVKNVALRAMANMVTIARAARETAIVRVDDWRIAIEMPNRVLTPELKADLPGRDEPFRMLVTFPPATT